MFPLALDLTQIHISLVGNGELTVKRLKQLQAAGATSYTVYSTRPHAQLSAAAGNRLSRRLPTESDIEKTHLLLVIDLPEEQAAPLAALACKLKKIVNVEDVKALCDAYYMSEVRRGDLILAISTSGKSPAVAVHLKQQLEEQFGPEWETILNEAATLRDQLRSQNAPKEKIMEETKTLLRTQATTIETTKKHGQQTMPALSSASLQNQQILQDAFIKTSTPHDSATASSAPSQGESFKRRTS